MAERPGPTRDHARWLLFGGILCVAALPRIWAAVWDQGIFWPDEIFQTLEQAHRFACGYGFVPWEFQEGARSWLLPGGLGLWWKLLAAFGVSRAPTLVITAKLVMVVLALVGIYASMRLAEKLGGREAAVLCGVLAALFPPSIVYGSRCMSEMASGPLCVIAALLVLDTDRWRLALAGCLAALAIYLRYQNGLITAGLFGWLLAARRGRAALTYAAGAVVIGLAGGLLDLWTWGEPFHSFVTYMRFNLIEGRSADFGVEPFAYYLTVSWSAVGVSILAVAVGLWECARRATGFLVIVLAYVLAHMLVGHKELRFMMPVVPLMLALSGVGLAAFIDRFHRAPVPARTRRTRGAQRRRGAAAQSVPGTASPFGVRATVWVVAGMLALGMSWRTARASFEDFGERHPPFAGTEPLWHTFEGANRLLWVAGERPDICGLGLIGYGPVWTGGYSYLHRDVPIVWATPGEALASPGLGDVGAAANYVLTRKEIALPPEYTLVDTIGEAKLARRPGSCAPPRAAYSRLLPK